MNGDELCRQLRVLVLQRFSDDRGRVVLPDGLTLVMHPTTWYTLAQDPEIDRRMDYHNRRLMDLPVQVDGEAEPFSWRLTVITTEEILAGTIERISP